MKTQYKKEGIYKLSKLFFVLIVTFCEGNGLTEVEENDSNDTLVCDDDAHKVVVCSHGFFFWSILVLMKMIQNIQTLSMRVDKIPVVSVINKLKRKLVWKPTKK